MGISVGIAISVIVFSLCAIVAEADRRALFMTEKILKLIDSEIEKLEADAAKAVTRYARGENDGAQSILRHLHFVITSMQINEKKREV